MTQPNTPQPTPPGPDGVTLDHLRTLPDGSLTRAEVNLLIDYIERLERNLPGERE